MPALPAKPPDIIVERWLPYKPQQRQIIYEKALTTNTMQPSTTDDDREKSLSMQHAHSSRYIENQMKSLRMLEDYSSHSQSSRDFDRSSPQLSGQRCHS
jgi:hypothetical protein